MEFAYDMKGFSPTIICNLFRFALLQDGVEKSWYALSRTSSGPILRPSFAEREAFV